MIGHNTPYWYNCVINTKTWAALIEAELFWSAAIKPVSTNIRVLRYFDTLSDIMAVIPKTVITAMMIEKMNEIFHMVHASKESAVIWYTSVENSGP